MNLNKNMLLIYSSLLSVLVRGTSTQDLATTVFTYMTWCVLFNLHVSLYTS